MTSHLLPLLVILGVAAGAPVALAETPKSGAHGLRLPATFTGTLPCADCPGIDHHLDLWPDGQGYALRRSYQERDLVVDEMGRWHVDPARNALILEGSGGAVSQWQITANEALRLLDQDGQPIESELPYELAAGALEPTGLALPLSGMVVYFADAAMLTECLTGQSFPMMMEAEFPALQRAYLEERPAPGAPLLVRIDAEIAMREQMEGPDRRSITVTRFHHATPDAGCPDHREPPDLVNVYWGLTLLDGASVPETAGRREPYLLFQDGEGLRFAATVGCNMMMGGVERDGDILRVGNVATTMMACPPGLDTLEASFARALDAARSHDLDGETLRLLDEDRVEVARFRARYTRY